MIVILEGPDNVGKTTQIKHIVKYFENHPFHVLKYSKVDVSDQEYYAKMLYRHMFCFIMDTDENFILDRSHLGEYVYANMYRGYDGDYVFKLEEEFRRRDQVKWDLDMFLITLIDDPQNLIDRDDGQSLSVLPTKKVVEIKRFIEANNRSMIKHKVLINVNGLTIEAVTAKIIEFFKENNIHV